MKLKEKHKELNKSDIKKQIDEVLMADNFEALR